MVKKLKRLTEKTNTITRSCFTLEKLAGGGGYLAYLSLSSVPSVVSAGSTAPGNIRNVGNTPTVTQTLSSSCWM
jgi:hypothetical protein